MTLQHLRFLVATVECGGVRKAAEHLNLSQPAVTGGLKVLEKELGQRLFEPKPNGRGIRATVKALEFYEDALDILRKCESARDRFVSSRKSAPTLRVGVLPTIASRQVEGFVLAMAARYPQLQLSFREAGKLRLESLFQKKAIDIAWTLVEKNETTMHRLWSEPYVALVGRAHRLACNSHAVLSRSDIQSESFVVRKSCEMRRSNLWPDNFQMRVSAWAERDELALKLVAAGVGIAIGPKSLATPDVISRSVREFQATRTVGVKWHRELAATTLGTVLGAFQASASSDVGTLFA